MTPGKKLPDISVVLAVRNSEDVIGGGTRRVVEHLRELDRPFEIVGVNAGSWDTSFKVLQLLAGQVPELRLIEKDMTGRAFIRGVSEARGSTVVLMDAARLPGSLSPLGWTLSRLDQGTEAVVVRGRCDHRPSPARSAGHRPGAWPRRSLRAELRARGPRPVGRGGGHRPPRSVRPARSGLAPARSLTVAAQHRLLSLRNRRRGRDLGTGQNLLEFGQCYRSWSRSSGSPC